MQIEPEQAPVERAIRLTEVAVKKLTGEPGRRREIRDVMTSGLFLRIRACWDSGFLAELGCDSSLGWTDSF